jgi:hypothetical protein
MTPEDPPASEGQATGHLRDLGDDELLGALRTLFSQRNSPPGWAVELAKGSYDLRAIDAELADLTSDSRLGTTRRLRTGGGPRLVVFEAAACTIEVEIEPGGRSGRWQLVGQLSPAGPARILLRRAAPAVPAWVDADELGRFTADDLAAGPLSLTCVRQGHQDTATAWISIG